MFKFVTTVGLLILSVSEYFKWKNLWLQKLNWKEIVENVAKNGLELFICHHPAIVF